ncbi:hypothetical protein ACJ41O_012498 [Fusarium nematophilum]
MPGTPNYTWRQVWPNSWQRSADEVETFWATAARLHDSAGRRPFEITGHVCLRVDLAALPPIASSDDVDLALRKAWTELRFHCPTIASQAEYNWEEQSFCKTYREIGSHEQLDRWLDTTFVKVSGVKSGIEFANSDPPAPDLPTLFVVTPIEPTTKGHVRRDLVFRAAHDTIDGAGTLLMLGKLLRYVSKALASGDQYPQPILDGSESANLSPPYRIAAGVPDRPSEHLQARIATMLQEHVFLGHPRPSLEGAQILSLPYKQGAQAPGRHQRCELTLCRNSTAAIIGACKNIGVTVTQAFHAAIPLVMRELLQQQPEEKRYVYTNDILYNLRPKCAHPYSTDSHAVSAYHSGSPTGFCVDVLLPSQDSQQLSPADKQKEFTRALSSVREMYEATRQDPDLAALAPHIWASHLVGMPPISQQPPPGPPPNPTPSVSLSSLGRIDPVIPPHLEALDISEPWVTGDEMGNGIGIFLITHRGRLSLGAAYNEAWHDRLEAERFLRHSVDLVREVLKIDVEEQIGSGYR